MAIIIATLGQKGGSGKSMLCRALAVELARKRKTVVVADLDIGQRTVTEWARAREANGIKPDVRVETVDPDHEPDFRIPELSEGADYVICDAPGWSDDLTLQLGSAADFLVIASEPSTDDMRPVIRVFHELTKAGIEPERIAIVLNRVSSEAEVTFARGYFKQAGVELLNVELPDQPSYRKAANVGQAATEVHGAPQARAATVVTALLKAVERVKKRAKPRQKSLRFKMKDGETW